MPAGHRPHPLPRPSYAPASQPPPTAAFSMPLPPSLTSMPPPVTQQHQYPALNSIPGMHSAVPSVPPAPPISAMSALPAIPSLQPFSNFPMPAIPTLVHPAPHSQPLPSNHLPAQLASAAMLSGAVEKKRRLQRRHRNLAYASVLAHDDPHSMMIAAQTHAAHALSAHQDPAAPAVAHTVPVYEADGIQFKILEQLPDTKIQRLRSEKIKPIETLTFNDIKAYNRNQLRAYCSVYGIRRKKKADMERDMARYAALFHPNDPAYDLSKFVPTEYADGPIPRRKVPVTKEQKEVAAGDTKRLTNALQQRPQASSSTIGQQHYASSSNSHHHGMSNRHGLQHQSNAISGAPRLHDIDGTHHSVGHSTGETRQHVGSHHGHHDNDEQGVGTELMSVPEMQVPNHLLQISHQIGEE